MVFPILVGHVPEDRTVPVVLDKCDYLGTGFYVAKHGIAITAAHLMAAPQPGAETSPFVLTWDGNAPGARRIMAAIVPDGTDIAILKVESLDNATLPISLRAVHMGEDVSSIGIPSDGSWGDKRDPRDNRTFKGHVTRSGRFLEISFAAPRGLSGSPVICQGAVVAVISGNHRSEALEDQVQESTEQVGAITKITRVETKAVVNFGLAEPLSNIRNFRHEQFQGKTFEDFAKDMNE